MEELDADSSEVTRKFLSIYFADADGWDEAIEHIKRFAGQRPQTISEDLQGLVKFLQAEHQERALANLVAWEANWVLDDPSDEGAREWLEKVAGTVRKILGDSAPPRP